MPVRPHVDADCDAHSSSGSIPAAIEPHVPLTPVPRSAALHAWQTPEQAPLQQKPSTQNVLAQSLPVVHAAPFALGVKQAPAALQRVPPVQSALLPHVVRHAVAPQT